MVALDAHTGIHGSTLEKEKEHGMKVYLGPYYHWFRPWSWLKRRAHDRDKDNARYDEINDWYSDSKWVRPLLLIERFVDNHTKRKIKVRIDYWDVWNFAHTLALIALPGLKLLKAKKHGAPFTDDEDAPAHLASTAPPVNPDDTDDGHTGANHFARWNWIMDEMIHAMECTANDEWEEQYHRPKYDQAGLVAAHARIRNGHRRFGKYFQALWD